MIILGGLILQCCVFGALLRPLEKPNKPAEIELVETEKLTSKRSDQEEEANKPKTKTLQTLKNIAKETFNFKLITENVSFLFISLSCFFMFLVYFIPFIYIPIRAKELGITEYAWLFSIIGIVNIPFRITFGFLADRKYVSAVTMNTICFFVATLCLFSYYFLNKFWMQAVFAVLFAMASAGNNCLTTPYLIEIVGDKKFRNANGIVSLFRGLGCMFGPYAGGFIQEMTGSGFYSLIFCGSAYTLSFLFSLAIDLINLTKKASSTSD